MNININNMMNINNTMNNNSSNKKSLRSHENFFLSLPSNIYRQKFDWLWIIALSHATAQLQLHDGPVTKIARAYTNLGNII